MPGGVSPEAFCDLLLQTVEESQAAALLVDLGGEIAALAHLEEFLLPRLRQRDFALLLRDRADLLTATGADGVHLTEITQLKALRGKLGDLSIGVACPLERHAAMIAAETGADYVAFDPAPAPAEALPLIQWWAEMMTVPSVVQAATPDEATRFTEAGADFIAVTADLWQQPDPRTALRGFVQAIG